MQVSKHADVFIFLDNGQVPNLAIGQEGVHTLLHEVGHALGLQHPTPKETAPHGRLPDMYSSYRYSAESYNKFVEKARWDSGRFPISPMLFDLVGLDAIYGLRGSVNAADNDTYTPALRTGMTIYDTNGDNDTLSAEGTGVSAFIDLRPGHFSSINTFGEQIGNVAIWFNTKIEHAIGSDKDDVIVGNELVNRLEGGAGADRISGGQGADILMGGTGRDIYRYTLGDGNDQIIDPDGGVIEITGPSGTQSFKLFATGDFLKTGSDTWTREVGEHTLTLSKKSPQQAAAAALSASTDSLTLAHNSPWQLTLEDGSIIDLGDSFDPVRFGMRLVEDDPAAAITTSRDILGDHVALNGELDDLGNLKLSGIAAPGQADVLKDSTGNDRILSGGGNDVINATRGGDDYAELGAGDDRAELGTGNDQALGGDGRDVLWGMSGKDQLAGQAGADVIWGGEGDDRVFAGEVETLDQARTRGETEAAAGAAELLYGGAGEDELIGAGRDVLLGGGGDDILRGDRHATLMAGYGLDWSVTRQVAAEGYANASYTDTYSGILASATPVAGSDWLFGELGNDVFDGSRQLRFKNSALAGRHGIEIPFSLQVQ